MRFNAIFFVIKKELIEYFYSPFTYLTIFIFLLLTGIQFVNSIITLGLIQQNYFFEILYTGAFIIIPIINMRTWAEEKNNDTLQILFSLPFTKLEILVGKFLAALIVFMCILMLASYPLLFMIFLTPININMIITGYIALLLVGALLTSLSQFISSMSKDQLTAVIVSIAFALLFYVLNNEYIIKYLNNPTLEQIVIHFSTGSHFTYIVSGLIHIKSLIYFLSLTLAFLYLCYNRVLVLINRDL